VPTFRELGLDIVHGASRGIVGPPGLPAEMAGRLERAFAAAMADEGFQREAQRSSMPLRPLSARPTARWRPGWTRSSESSGRSAPGGAERNAISHAPETPTRHDAG
jgi:hypothetical protein